MISTEFRITHNIIDYKGHRVGCLHSLDWTTGLDYWTEVFSSFGQDSVVFGLNYSISVIL